MTLKLHILGCEESGKEKSELFRVSTIQQRLDLADKMYAVAEAAFPKFILNGNLGRRLVRRVILGCRFAVARISK